MKKYTIGVIGVEIMNEDTLTANHLPALSYVMQTDDLQNLYQYIELLALQNHRLLRLSLADVVERFTYEQSYQNPCRYEMIDEGLLCWVIYGRTEVMHQYFDFEDNIQYEDASYLTEYGSIHTVEEMKKTAIECLLANPINE